MADNTCGRHAFHERRITAAFTTYNSAIGSKIERLRALRRNLEARHEEWTRLIARVRETAGRLDAATVRDAEVRVREESSARLERFREEERRSDDYRNLVRLQRDAEYRAQLQERANAIIAGPAGRGIAWFREVIERAGERWRGAPAPAAPAAAPWIFAQTMAEEGVRLREVAQNLRRQTELHVESVASAKELAYVHRAMAAATRDAIGPMAARHEEAVHLEMALESLETQLDRLTEAARRQEAAARGVYEDLVGTLAQIANASRELCVNVERFSTLKDVRRYLQQFKPPEEVPDVSRCTGGAAFAPMPYQLIPPALMTPEYPKNLLVYHDMGTGKSCTLVMCLLALAKYYRHAEPGERPPGALVLLQNDHPAYIGEIRKGCGQGALAELGVDAADLSDASRWTFRDAEGRIYFDVAFNKYTQALQTEPAWKIEGGPDVPQRGAVLVDEAHNLFAVGAGVRANTYIEQMKANSDLKLVFFTGTPVKNSLPGLMTMLNTLRGDMKLQAAPEYYFTALPGGAWRWNDGKREEFGQDVLGYVSYATLEREPSIYPQFGARVRIAEDMTISQEGGAELTATRTHDGCGFAFAKTADTDNSLVLVKVPALAGVGRRNPFYAYADLHELPPIWYACGCLLNLNADKKHFLYLWKESPRYPALPNFKAHLHANHNVTFLDWEDFCRGLAEDVAQDEAVRVFQEHFPPLGDDIRAVDISTPRKFSLFEKIYNSAENARGQLIRVVLGGSNNREGVSLFSTHCVHVLQPPGDQGNFRQAIRRVTRYCSMGQVEPGEAFVNWVVTVLVYCAPTQLGEARALRINATGGDPADLAQVALQHAAIDCSALAPLNRLRGGPLDGLGGGCDVDAAAAVHETFTCVNLTDLSEVEGVAHQASCPHLWTTQRYTLTDEILLQFLTNIADDDLPGGDERDTFFLLPTVSLQDTYALLQRRTGVFKRRLHAYLTAKRAEVPEESLRRLARLARRASEALLAEHRLERRIEVELQGWDALLEESEVDDDESRLNRMWQEVRKMVSDLHH